MVSSSVVTSLKEERFRRISVGRTLGAAYALVGRHVAAFAFLSVLLAIVTDGCIYLAEWQVDEETPETLSTAINGAGGFGGMLLAWIMGVAICIVWFRVILLDEPHPWRSYLRWGRREFRFLGVDFLVGVAMAAPMATIAAAGAYYGFMSRGDAEGMEEYIVPLTAGTMVWGAVCWAWLGFAYPAIATDAPGGSLRLSWRLSRGQRLPLFFVYLVGVGIWYLALLAILFVAPDAMATLRPIDFLTTVLSYWANMCFIAVAAAAYAQLQNHSIAAVADAFD